MLSSVLKNIKIVEAGHNLKLANQKMSLRLKEVLFAHE